MVASAQKIQENKLFTVSPFPKVKGINSFIHNLTHLDTHHASHVPCYALPLHSGTLQIIANF